MNTPTESTDQVLDLLTTQIANAETQWSLGTFGGIAEFSRDADEPVRLATSDRHVSAVTARGGVAIAAHEKLRLFASESVTKQSWSHRVALCLPTDACAMNRRSALTELGADEDALREQDRGGVLFDLGLDVLQADLCIRFADRDVAAQLRPYLGRSVFEPGNPAMGVILAASPHRVFISRIGRVEVFQPIPAATDRSPDGPHTHVLPKLLKSKRTHPATEPVPDGLIPCAHLYPAHPGRNAMGDERPFGYAQHVAVQRLIERLGAPETFAFKQQVIDAVAQELPPFPPETAVDRHARITLRVALRQLKATGHPSRVLPQWLEAFDRIDPADEDQDDAAKQHDHRHR